MSFCHDRFGPARRVAALVPVLLALLPAMAQPAAAQSAPANSQVLREACAADYLAHCSDVQPGGGRILVCLQQHSAQLSADCRQALDAAGTAPASPKSGS